MDEELTLNSGPEPQLTINAQGDLHVIGWGNPTVGIDVDDPDEDLRTREGDGRLWLDLRDDATLHVPHAAKLHFARVAGDLRVQQVHGVLKLDQLDGDVELRECGLVEVTHARGDFSAKALDQGLRADLIEGDAALRDAGGPVTFGRVAGDLSIRNVAGDLAVETVNGDASLRGVEGALQVGSILGDLSLADVTGAAQVERVNGDADLQAVTGPVRIEQVLGDLSATEIDKSLQVARVNGDAELRLLLEEDDLAVQVSALGEINCEVEPDANASFVLRGDGGVRCQLPRVIPNRQNDREMTFTLGTGAAKVMLRANGKVVVSPAGAWPHVDADFGVEMESFGDELAHRIEAEVEQKLRQLDERLVTLGVHFGERDKASIRRAQERARQASERARNRAERAAERAHRHTGGPAGPAWLPPRPPVPPTPPRPPSEPVRDDERLAILKMVADKTISPAEAEKLLAALEG